MRFVAAVCLSFSLFLGSSPFVFADPDEKLELISGVYLQLNTKLADLTKQSENLRLTLGQLSEKFPENAPLNVQEIEANIELFRQFSGGFFDYRSQRSIMWTELFLNAFHKIAVAEPDKALAASQMISKETAEFKTALAELESFQSKPEEKSYLGWSNNMADVLDSLFRSHRGILVKISEFNQNYFSNRNVFSALQSQVGYIFSFVNSFAEKLIFNRLENRIRNNQDFWAMVETVIGAKAKLAGYKFDFQKTYGNTPLKSGEVNIFVAPHGTPDEVALFAAKISRNLPAGRKAAVISAVYHFSDQMSGGDRNKALEIGNALAAHQNIIGIMGALSPLKGEKIETRSMFAQMEEAIHKGVTDFVLFPEGRSASYDGGFTPIHPNTSLALLYLAQKLKNSSVKKSLKVTVLGASLPNLSYDLGKDKDVLSLKEIQELSIQDLEKFKGKPEILNHYIEFLWHRYVFVRHPHRFASAESDMSLVEELSKKPNLLVGALQCPNVYKFVHSTFLF